LLLAALIVGALVVGGVFTFRVVLSGVPFIDEWHCSKGEAPATNEVGGSACFPEGATLPAGMVWDPLGNRPFSCEDRRGWTEIYRNQETDCLRDGIDLPDGWSS
jgi:hypothetical protein